jgi:hypothetical protein
MTENCAIPSNGQTDDLFIGMSFANHGLELRSGKLAQGAGLVRDSESINQMVKL